MQSLATDRHLCAPVGIERGIPESEWLQTHTLCHAATGVTVLVMGNYTDYSLFWRELVLAVILTDRLMYLSTVTCLMGVGSCCVELAMGM